MWRTQVGGTRCRTRRRRRVHTRPPKGCFSPKIITPFSLKSSRLQTTPKGTSSARHGGPSWRRTGRSSTCLSSLPRGRGPRRCSVFFWSSSEALLTFSPFAPFHNLDKLLGVDTDIGTLSMLRLNTLFSFLALTALSLAVNIPTLPSGWSCVGCLYEGRGQRIMTESRESQRCAAKWQYGERTA